MKSFVGSFGTILVLMCSACASQGPTPSDPNPETTPNLIRPHVDDFIVDVERDPETGAIQGLLESYQLKMDTLIDPDQRADIKSGKLSGETVVFGLDGTGDRGVFYDIALERAAEIFADSPYSDVVANEIDAPGSIALVRFETPGFPSGTPGGSDVPVYVVPVGNCTDITNGHIYPTELRCEKSDEVLLIHPYGSFSADEIVPSDWYFDAVRNYDFNVTDDELFDEDGKIRLDVLSERKIPLPSAAKPDITIRKYLLLRGFVLSRNTSWQEVGRDKIMITLVNDHEEIVDGVVEALKSSKLHLHVERVEGSLRKVVVTPQIRDEDVERLYDRIRVMRIDIRPRRKAIVVIDDNNGRIMIIGPKSYRKLLDKLTFPLRSADYSGGGWKPSMDFRLIATPTGNGNLKVEWTRLEKGSLVDEGKEEIENDIGVLLRLIYTRGCSVDDCALLVLNAREKKVLNARIDLQQHRLDARKE